MKNSIIRLRLCLAICFFVTAFFLNGCSVFSSIGDTISLGYENMVSYFNGYYNAKNLFDDAEDEINAAALAARGKEVPAGQANQIPQTAKQKFGQVIDKCSNILAFHPSSSLVDDALLLVGKSFFYQAEYLKAERKFAELLAQFPNSPLALEAQLWFARSDEKLGKLDDGVRLSDAVVLAAQTSNENEIETQAHQLLGVLYRRLNQTEKSIAEYEKLISISNNDDAKSEAQIQMGDIYFGDGQFKKAAEVYLRTEEYTSDIYSNYYSHLQASIAYRKLGDHKKGLSLVNAMIDNFRNREYLPALYLERANNYAASGRQDDAMNEYVYVDTSYARTEYAVRSAYQLGMIFEKESGLYQQALKYYSEVNAATGSSIVAEGRRKFTAFTRYFTAWRQLHTVDSLFAVLRDTSRTLQTDTVHAIAADSSRKSIPDTLLVGAGVSRRKKVSDRLQAIAADSHHQKPGRADSLLVASTTDSLNSKNTVADTTHRKPDHVAARSSLPSADSLNLLRSVAAQELGDIFYSEIVEPDSALYWYHRSLEWSYHQSRSPRILYILAELSRMNPGKKFPAPEEYYVRLNHDFPESVYAEEARRFLQKESSAVKTDTAAEYYAQSENHIDAKEYAKAIGTLRSLVRSFPKSPLAAKSEYAIGWIMEHRLAKPDSAMAQYRRVVKNYKGTTYALAASNRVLEVPRTDTVKGDTVKTKNKPQLPKSSQPDSTQVKTTGVIKDTVQQRPILPPDELEGKPRTRPAAKRSLEVQRSDTVKIDTVNTKNTPQLPKSSQPDTVQGKTRGVIKDTVIQTPVPPRSALEKMEKEQPASTQQAPGAK